VELICKKAVQNRAKGKLEDQLVFSFNEMFVLYPSLVNEDRIKLTNIFSTLAKFAPSLASDPHAAGAYIKRIMAYDPDQGADYNVIQNLVKLEKDHQQTKTFGVDNSANQMIGPFATQVAKGMFDVPDESKHYDVGIATSP